MAKPICSGEIKGKRLREEAKHIICTHYYVRWTKTLMVRARRRFNKLATYNQF